MGSIVQLSKKYRKVECGNWRKYILEVFLEAIKGNKLGHTHASSLFTLLGDLEMSQVTLSLGFTLWKIGNVISWKGYFWQAPEKGKLWYFHPALWWRWGWRICSNLQWAPNQAKSETSIRHCALVTALWKSALKPSEQIQINEAEESPKEEGTRKERVDDTLGLFQRNQAISGLEIWKGQS